MSSEYSVTGWLVAWALFLFAAYAGIRKRYRKRGLSKWIRIIAIVTLIVIPAGLVFSVGVLELAVIATLVVAIFLFP